MNTFKPEEYNADEVYDLVGQRLMTYSDFIAWVGYIQEPRLGGWYLTGGIQPDVGINIKLEVKFRDGKTSTGFANSFIGGMT